VAEGRAGALAGRRVVVTRAPHQAAELAALLEAEGAEAILYPCIDIAPPEDASPLDDGLRRAAAGEFDWLVLTSRNTVLALARRLDALGMSPSMLSGLRVAAVGPSTAAQSADLLGLTPSVVPDEHVAEALADALAGRSGARVFLPQSSRARPVLAEALRGAGMDVTAVDAYITVIGSGGADVPALLRAGEVDAVTFTSSSTVENFLARLTAEGATLSDLGGVVVACIGPITARTARTCGLAVDAMPEDYTLGGLVAALAAFCHTPSTQ
jgi:uroporphyrinogen-III synthase